MDLKDVPFMASLAGLCTTFLKNCGRSIGIKTCKKTVVGGKQGHAACKTFAPNNLTIVTINVTGTK